MGKPTRVKPVVRPDESIVGNERTQGSEPSQYQEEKKETSIPKVVASEIGTSLNQSSPSGEAGVVGSATVELPIQSLAEALWKEGP